MQTRIRRRRGDVSMTTTLAKVALAAVLLAIPLGARAEGASSAGTRACGEGWIARVADVERMQMLVESASRPALQRFLAGWLPTLHALRPQHKRLLRWAVDVDPLAI